MAIRINLRTAGVKDSTKMDVEPDDTMEEIIDSATDYWDKEPEEHVLKKGSVILEGQTKVSDADLRDGDILLLVHRDDIGKRVEFEPSSEIDYVKNWIFENIGIRQKDLVLDQESYKGELHTLILQDKSDKKRYMIVIDGNGEIKEYRPLEM